MANYCEQFRTNYFKVKDVQKFKEAVEEVVDSSEIEVWEDKSEEGEVLVGVGGYASCPYYVEDEETGEMVDIDFMKIIASHLVEGWVAILMFNGNEKLRYLTGGASAINSKGETRSINIASIHHLAKELGENITLTEC